MNIIPAFLYGVLHPKEKYRILLDSKHTHDVYGLQVHRIQAVRRIKRGNGMPDVKPGDLGGYVWSPHNLSHQGTCWIGGNAVALGTVQDDAQVDGNAFIGKRAVVSGQAWVGDYACVGGFYPIDGSRIFGRVLVDSATVRGWACILNGNTTKDTVISNCSTVLDRARVYGGAVVDELSEISGSAIIGGNLHMSGGSMIRGDLSILVTGAGTVKMHGESIYHEADPMHGNIAKTLAVEVPVDEGEERASLLDYVEEVAGDSFPSRGVGKYFTPAVRGSFTPEAYKSSGLGERITGVLRWLSCLK